MIDVWLSSASLTVLVSLFLGHLFVFVLAMIKRKELPSHKSHRPMNRIKLRTAFGSLIICVLQSLVVVGSLILTLKGHLLDSMYYEFVLLLIEFVGTITITVVLLMMARVHCSSIIYIVQRSIPHVTVTAKRVQTWLFILEVLLITLGMLPKIGADIKYYSEFTNDPSVTHSHRATRIKMITDRTFDVFVTLATMCISISAISFTIYFARREKEKRKNLFMVQGMIIVFIIYSILRTIVMSIYYSFTRNHKFSANTNRIWLVHVTTLLREMLLFTHFCLMIKMPHHLSIESPTTEDERFPDETTSINRSEYKPTYDRIIVTDRTSTI
jgi:hypothetical protein